jgi:hypothetical protein
MCCPSADIFVSVLISNAPPPGQRGSRRQLALTHQPEAAARVGGLLVFHGEALYAVV